MSRQDVEFFQSFIRKYINKVVRLHFEDIKFVGEDNLNINNPREAAKKLCLHKNTDPMILTLGRLLFWWVETKGLLEEYIYGVPASNFHETVRFLPQIKLFWRESTQDAKDNGRYPIRARHTVRFRGDYATRDDLRLLANKITKIFNSSSTHNFLKGQEKYSYRDKEKGYEFIITASNITEAEKVINALLQIQDDNPLNKALLTKSTKEKDWTEVETIRVAGETFTKPKERQIGKVWFTHAEFSIHGMPKDKILVSNLSEKIPTKLI